MDIGNDKMVLLKEQHEVIIDLFLDMQAACYTTKEAIKRQLQRIKAYGYYKSLLDKFEELNDEFRLALLKTENAEILDMGRDNTSRI